MPRLAPRQRPVVGRSSSRGTRRGLALGSAGALCALALASPEGATAVGNGRAELPIGDAERAGIHAIAAVQVFSPSLAWAVGSHGGGVLKPSFRVWNGSTWTEHTQLTKPAPRIHDVDALNPDDAWMVGFVHAASKPLPQALAAHWDGHTWQITRTPNPTQRGFDAVDASDSDDVWTVGLRTLGTRYETLAEHWDGASWTVFPTPNFPGDDYNNLLDVVVFGPDDAWALGQTFSSQRSSFTEHWDGHRWTFVPLPNSQDRINALGGSGPGDLWAVGSGTSGTATYHWDGVQWVDVACPDPPSRSGVLHAITVLAPDDIWAVGESYYQTPIATLTEHWDGSQWSIVDSPRPGMQETELSAVDGDASDDVWAVGTKTVGDDSAKVLYLHWDGASWTAVPAQ